MSRFMSRAYLLCLPFRRLPDLCQYFLPLRFGSFISLFLAVLFDARSVHVSDPSREAVLVGFNKPYQVLSCRGTGEKTYDRTG